MNLWNSFLEAVGDLIETESVKELWNITHHMSLSCYEHSVFVAYTSYCTAYKMGLDCVSAARAGLLHDLYLYDTNEMSQFKHYFTHAEHALANAREVCDLSNKEENIIASHMWPASKVAPRSPEAFIVSACDKYCAVAEFLHIWHRMKIRRRIPAISAT